MLEACVLAPPGFLQPFTLWAKAETVSISVVDKQKQGSDCRQFPACGPARSKAMVAAIDVCPRIHIQDLTVAGHPVEDDLAFNS